MYINKIYLLISILILVTGNGCTRKPIEVISNIFPTDAEVGQIIEIGTIEELALDIYKKDIYPKADVEVATTVRTDRLTTEVVEKNSFSIKGKLIKVLDTATNSYVFNQKEDHIVEIKFEEIDFVRVRAVKAARCNYQRIVQDITDSYKEGLSEDWILVSISSTYAPTTTTVELIRCPSEYRAAYQKWQQYRFVVLTRDKLARDILNGGGEYVATMSYLHGCPSEIHDRYAFIAKQHFSTIFIRSELNPIIILSNLEKQIEMDPILSKECIWVT
ncbi:DUF3015 family protein [Neptunomonas sp.]|uniref:DUF3015 family protein n=1 Tax=Neptunomonas sp. TaxID=1971898 RepID=UPI00356695A9